MSVAGSKFLASSSLIPYLGKIIFRASDWTAKTPAWKGEVTRCKVICFWFNLILHSMFICIIFIYDFRQKNQGWSSVHILRVIVHHRYFPYSKCQPFLAWLLFFDEMHNVIHNSFSSDTGKSIYSYLHNNSTVVTNFHRYLHILCRFQRNHQGKHICHRRISRTRGSCYKLEGALSLDLKQKHQSHYVYC